MSQVSEVNWERVRPTLARRLLFGADDGDARLAWIIVVGVLLVYVASFLAFYPTARTNDDEAQYIQQAQLLVDGKRSTTKIDPLTGETEDFEPSRYPVGTAALMAPFVSVFGWRGAYLSGLIALLAATLFTGRWLQDEGYSPFYALVVVAFPASLVMGRVATSDVPSVAAVSLGLWLFWRGLDRGTSWWLASGFVAGASAIFRESNVLPFVPFFAGTVLRREKECWALVVGGLAGTAVRLISAWLYFGDPFFLKVTYLTGFHTIHERLPLYLLGLLVFVPGGLLAGVLYRGRRRPELLVALAIFFVFYIIQPYGMEASAFLKRIAIALRYFIPLLPLLAFALAEVVPRYGEPLLERLGPRRGMGLERAVSALLVVGIAGLLVACVGAHVTLDRWSASQAVIRSAIHEHTGDDSILVVDWFAIRKHLRNLERPYEAIHRREVSSEEVAGLVDRYGEVFVVMLHRGDSSYWLESNKANDEFIASLEPTPVLELDLEVTATDHLRIWRMKSDAPAPDALEAVREP